MIYDLEDKLIILVGDVHGSFYSITELCKQFQNIYILQVGDFGIGFEQNKLKEQRILKNLAESLIRSNNHLFVIRGNHDNPAYFNDQTIEERITFLSDYSILNQNGKKILCVGGGISIDRVHRKIGTSYWVDEVFVLDEQKIVEADVLVTHVAPKEFPLITLQSNSLVKTFCKVDHKLDSDLKRESNLVQSLVNLSKCKKHYFGHFHVSMKYDTSSCIYTCLDIDETKQLEW